MAEPSRFPKVALAQIGQTKEYFVPTGFRIDPVHLATDDPSKNTRGLHMVRHGTEKGFFSVLIGLGHNPFQTMRSDIFLRTLAVQYNGLNKEPIGFLMSGGVGPWKQRGTSRAILTDYRHENHTKTVDKTFGLITNLFNGLRATNIVSEDNEVSASGLAEFLQCIDTVDWIDGLLTDPDATIQEMVEYIGEAEYTFQDTSMDPEYDYDEDDQLIMEDLDEPSPGSVTHGYDYADDQDDNILDILFYPEGEENACVPLTEHMQKPPLKTTVVVGCLPKGEPLRMGTACNALPSHFIAKFDTDPHPNMVWGGFHGWIWHWKEGDDPHRFTPTDRDKSRFAMVRKMRPYDHLWPETGQGEVSSMEYMLDIIELLELDMLPMELT